MFVDLKDLQEADTWSTRKTYTGVPLNCFQNATPHLSVDYNPRVPEC